MVKRAGKRKIPQRKIPAVKVPKNIFPVTLNSLKKVHAAVRIINNAKPHRCEYGNKFPAHKNGFAHPMMPTGGKVRTTKSRATLKMRKIKRKIHGKSLSSRNLILLLNPQHKIKGMDKMTELENHNDTP